MRFFPGLSAAFFAFAFVLAPAGAQQTTAPIASVSLLAPADEYFGHFRLSVLGISNTIHLAVQRLENGFDAHAVCEGSLAFAGDSIGAWEHAYPRDPAIPRELLALERAYLLAPSGEARAHALATEAWILRDYAGSDVARTAEAELSGPEAARR
jgi:hypothetical protein